MMLSVLDLETAVEARRRDATARAEQARRLASAPGRSTRPGPDRVLAAWRALAAAVGADGAGLLRPTARCCAAA